MSFEFINTLSESRLIPSKTSYRQYDAQDISEMVALYLCTLYILYCERESRETAISYARRTLQYGIHFGTWHTGGTDLYALLHGITDGTDIDFRNQSRSERFRHQLPMDEILIVRWIRELSQGSIRPGTHRQLFIRLDFNLKIENQSIRSVRRLVMDWKDLAEPEARLATTRLLQLLRNRAPRSELLGTLKDMADRHHLEINGARNKEAGIPKYNEPPKDINVPAAEPKSNLLRSLATVGAGYAAGRFIGSRLRK